MLAGSKLAHTVSQAPPLVLARHSHTAGDALLLPLLGANSSRARRGCSSTLLTYESGTSGLLQPDQQLHRPPAAHSMVRYSLC
jgi:hypothetical protein